MKKNTNIVMKSVDFLSTDLFIYWRIHPSKELDKYWYDFIHKNEHLSEAFKKAIEEFDRIQQIHPDFYLNDENHLKQKIEEKIQFYKNKAKRKRLIYYPSSAAAIILILMLFINNKNTFLLKEDLVAEFIVPQNEILLLSGQEVTTIENNATLYISTKNNKGVLLDSISETEVKLDESHINKLIVPFGKRSSIVLPDGSRVWLNSGTELEFPSLFPSEIREIKVNGEIFIDVIEINNKPFVINTPNSQVRVYGTSFNVSAYEDEETESVVLVQGSVEVLSNNSSLFLEPNHIAEIKNGEINSRTVDILEYISWRDGFIKLNKTPLKEVLNKIGKYYNVEFVHPPQLDLSSKTCSGTLLFSDDIDDLLNSFSNMTLLKYEYKHDNIIQIKE